MRRSVLLAIGVTALLLAGCTSGSTGATSAGPGATPAVSDAASAAEASRAPGVTADAIRIGVTYVDQKALTAAGISIALGDYKDSYQALIDQINAAGGIHGRKIEATYVPINPVGTDPAQVACVHLTQDIKVFVVVGFFLNDAVLCPLHTEDTATIGGMQTPELLGQAKAPWFTVYPGSEVPVNAVKAFDQKKLLTGNIGVYAQAADEGLLDQQIMPELAKLGVHATKAVLDAPSSDVPATVSETRTIAQRFQSEGIKKVLLVGPSSDDWFKAMPGQSYRPQLLISDDSAVTAFLADQTTTNTSVLTGAVEGKAYSQGTWVYDEPSLQTCFKALERAGVTVPEPNPSDPNAKDFTGPEDACTNLALLKALLERAGRSLNYATFRRAGYTLGEITIPGDPTPRHYGPPPATDGSPQVHVLVWNTAKAAFVPDS